MTVEEIHVCRGYQTIPMGVSAGMVPMEEAQEARLSEEEIMALLRQLHYRAKQILTRPCEQWDLSVRATNVLTARGLHTLADLVDLTAKDVLSLPRCGATTIGEIVTEARSRGYFLEHWIAALQQIQHHKYNKR